MITSERLGVMMRDALVRSYTLLFLFLLFGSFIIYMLRYYHTFFHRNVDKNFRGFSHANQETNASIESYHMHIKSHYLTDCSIKCTRRMDWLIHVLLHRVEPYYRNKRNLQLSRFLMNFKKERYFITTLERSKSIEDTNNCPYDLLIDTYNIRSQTISTKWYFVRKFGPNFLTRYHLIEMV